MAMSIALMLAAVLAPSPAAAPAAAPPRAGADVPVDRSLGDADRLNELRIHVRSARERGEIDDSTAAQLYIGIERVRRQMAVMGMQFGYRQRVRLRARIDRLYERLARSRIPATASLRSEN